MIAYSEMFLTATVILSAAAIVYAYRKGKIDFSALVASGVVGALALFAVGATWLYLIIGFFVAGNLVTHYKCHVKAKRGMAQETRTFRNVLGNGAAAIIFALLYHFTGQPIMLVGFVGAMAAAAADTFATEIGEVHSKEPRLITTLEKARTGTNGAISFAGFLAAITGAAIISVIPIFFPVGFDKTILFVIGTISGFAGCCADSLVGATLEGKTPHVDNHVTNFIGTLSGGVSAVFLYWLVFL